ncbi:hypothetical protein CO731_00848 [Aminobacter sp. MSH1]|uniref:hypothetical protein n=1 Tax=Aminobacter sp. MSH1 TaxID=374606 RepID=UPI000D3466C0|nr:hypothetical protein [Aminobacter sp. MSH1]AWC21397.1 hypothetical protein CO731_00848 [Aminobacter sp. MSH1]
MSLTVKGKKRQARAAAKAPGWLRDIAAATFDPQGNRRYREQKLGTLGPASDVRRIDPADYLSKEAK